MVLNQNLEKILEMADKNFLKDFEWNEFLNIDNCTHYKERQNDLTANCSCLDFFLSKWYKDELQNNFYTEEDSCHRTIFLWLKAFERFQVLSLPHACHVTLLQI
jgi:hypothetical protein